MTRISEYGDGWTDLSNGCIMTESGVRKLKAPFPTWLSEKIGKSLIIVADRIDSFRHLKLEVEPRINPNPRVARAVGYTCMALATGVAAIKFGDGIGEIVSGGVGIVSNSIDTLVIEPMESIPRSRP